MSPQERKNNMTGIEMTGMIIVLAMFMIFICVAISMFGG